MGLDLPNNVDPGFDEEMAKTYVSQSPSNSTYILKFDGRSIRPGFLGDFGDVDLGSCEKGLSLIQELKLWEDDIEALNGA